MCLCMRGLYARVYLGHCWPLCWGAECFSEHLSSTTLKLRVTFKPTFLPCLDCISFGNSPAGTQQCLLCSLLLAIAKASHWCPWFNPNLCVCVFEHVHEFFVFQYVPGFFLFCLKPAPLPWMLDQTVAGSSFNLWNISIDLTLKSFAKQMQTGNKENGVWMYMKCKQILPDSRLQFTCPKIAKLSLFTQLFPSRFCILLLK